VAPGSDAESRDVLEARPPALSCAEAERIAVELFGVVAQASALESERDQNFLLRSRDGRERVLKVANHAEDPAVLDFQNAALLHLFARDPDLPVPRVVPTRTGEGSAAVLGSDGRRHVVRVLTYLPGLLLGEVPRGAGLHRDLGSILARLGRALRGFFHPAAGWERLWDLKHAARLREHLVDVANPELRRLASGPLERFERSVLPALPGLRAQVIHNDVSRHNTLVDARGERVVGIVDFGDMSAARGAVIPSTSDGRRDPTPGSSIGAWRFATGSGRGSSTGPCGRWTSCGSRRWASPRATCSRSASGRVSTSLTTVRA
jgi:Ser/Thr protein kinase RdoA (MazF antagonist)